jgi:hypothetical protein
LDFTSRSVDLERLAVSPGDRVLPEDPWQSAGRLLLETD